MDKQKKILADGSVVDTIPKTKWQRIITLPGLLKNYFKAIKSKQDTRIGNFIHANRKYLVIICDPQTDKLIMAYKDKVVINRICSADGKNTKVVKHALRHSTFKRFIDEFLNKLSESLELRIRDGNQFFQWVDAGLYAISQSLKKKDIK